MGKKLIHQNQLDGVLVFRMSFIAPFARRVTVRA
jgi:hypothetical protein